MKAKRLVIIGIMLISMVLLGACRGSDMKSPFIDAEDTSDVMAESSKVESSSKEDSSSESETETEES